MAYFLVKADPEEDYSIEDLKRDGETAWTGVHSFVAIGHIKAMKPRDTVYFYHSGKQKAIVGLAEVSSEPHEDKDDPRPSWAVKLKYIKTFDKVATLAELKAMSGLADFALIRIGRLSVMPVSDKHRKLIDSLLS